MKANGAIGLISSSDLSIKTTKADVLDSSLESFLKNSPLERAFRPLTAAIRHMR
jgi:hypothetical protein